MKRLKKIIPVLLLVIFGYCLPVSAEDAKTDTYIQWKADEKQESAQLIFVPDQELVNNAVTTMQITMLVTDISGDNPGVSVSFDQSGAGAYRISDYRYNQEKKELNIFLSDTKLLFNKGTKSCSIGTVSLNTDTADCEIMIQPISVKTVSQSHAAGEIQSGDLADMAVNLKRGSGTDSPDEPEQPDHPDNPGGTDNPDVPGDSGQPDNPNVPDNPGQPDNPDVPVNPGQPDNPEQPGNPDVPENPGTPGNPGQPDADAVYDNVRDVVKELEEGQTAQITYKIGKDTVLSDEDQKTIFQALKGTDKSLTFAVEDEGGLLYSFTFRGDQITNENIVMDFRMTTLLSSPDIEKLLQKGAQNLVLEFSHSGKLPGPAEVKVYAGSVFADGQKLYLYYYNPDKKSLEPVQKDIVVNGGYAAFELTHCSSYALTAKEVKEAGKFPVPGEQVASGGAGGKKDTQKSNVATGDNSPVVLYIVLLAIAAAALITAVIWRRIRK